jgi:outer membrane biosynthesis protein TonB
MKKYLLHYAWGLLALGIYLFIIAALIVYFNVSSEEKPKHFVKKNEKSVRGTLIEVSIKNIAAQKTKPKTVAKEVVIPKPVVKKPVPKEIVKKVVKKEIPKKIVPPKEIVKKEIPKKVVKKPVKKKPIVKKDKAIVKEKKKVTVSQKPKTEKPKKVLKTKDLFSKVATEKKVEKAVTSSTKKETQKPKVKASDLMSSLTAGKKSDMGIANAYLANIETKLHGWPAQSEYAGEKAKVWLKIQPNGSFEFKVISASASEGFNEGLKAYLGQLQNIGFGRHKAKRAYEINVEFVATD